MKAQEPSERKELVSQIVEALVLHSAAEEKLVYPILNLQDEESSRIAYEEHHIMKFSLFEVSQLNGTENNFRAKVKVLCDTVNRHVLEEEAQMLPKIQHSGFDMVELADSIRAMKEEMRAHGVPQVGISEHLNQQSAVTSTKDIHKPASKTKKATSKALPKAEKAVKPSNTKRTKTTSTKSAKVSSKSEKRGTSAAKKRSAA